MGSFRWDFRHRSVLLGSGIWTEQWTDGDNVQLLEYLSVLDDWLKRRLIDVTSFRCPRDLYGIILDVESNYERCSLYDIDEETNTYPENCVFFPGEQQYYPINTSVMAYQYLDRVRNGNGFRLYRLQILYYLGIGMSTLIEYISLPLRSHFDYA